MNSKIAPLAPLTLTPSNSKGKGGLAPLPGLSTPASLDKLEKPKSRGGDRSTNKSTTEKKKARKAKMEKLRQSKHATHIQAVWRGSRARKVGIEKHEEEKIVEPLSHSCEKSEERAVIEEGSGEISPETIDSKGSTTRTDSDEMLKKTCVEPKLQDNAVISNISTTDSREGSSLRKEGGQEETLTCPIEDSDIVPVKDKDITKCEMDTNEVDGSTKKEILPEVDSAVSSTLNVELGATTEDQKEQQDKDELKAQQLDQQQGESTEDADSRKPSVWPDSHHDSFTTIGDTEVAWPDLTNSNPESVLQWVLQHQQVLIRTVTWNMQANDPPPVDEVRKTLLPLNRFHIIGFGTEECERSIAKSAINPSKKIWESYVVDLAGDQYVPLRSHTLQAIHMMLFVHKSVEPLITNVSSAAIACGMANTLGNKGGVGISFKIANSRMLILNSHLSAHQGKVAERNFQVWKILNELADLLNMEDNAGKNADNGGNVGDVKSDDVKELVRKGSGSDDENSDNEQTENDISVKPSNFKGVDKIEKYYDCLIFMGDMNYRINGNRNIIDKLLLANMHEVLMSNDQLTVSFEQNKLPKFLIESPISFRPTYKFNKKSDVYDTSAKKRIPSWTDRILYKSDNLTCLTYNSVPDIRISDHRPVYATFLAKIFVQKEHVKKDDDKIAFSSESQVCTIM